MAAEDSLADKKLVILWTTADHETAERMVFMYARNSKIRGWWEEVCLVVWGASQRLLCESPDLQEELDQFQKAGGEVQACIACAELYGLTEKLRGLGIEVKSMGDPLTRYLKQGLRVLSI